MIVTENIKVSVGNSFEGAPGDMGHGVWVEVSEGDQKVVACVKVTELVNWPSEDRRELFIRNWTWAQLVPTRLGKDIQDGFVVGTITKTAIDQDWGTYAYPTPDLFGENP